MNYNGYNYNSYPNMLPPQQILQANGKASVDMVRMSPNSSVLIADTTAPIVWRCTSDGLGNVTAEPFDITPHKDEVQIEKENLSASLNEINNRISILEEIINDKSIISTDTSADAEFITNHSNTKKRTKSTSNAKSNDSE